MRENDRKRNIRRISKALRRNKGKRNGALQQRVQSAARCTRSERRGVFRVRARAAAPLFLSPRVLLDPRLATFTVKVSAFHGHRDHARPTHSHLVSPSLPPERSARTWPIRGRVSVRCCSSVGNSAIALQSYTLHRGTGRVSYLRLDHLGDTRLGTPSSTSPFASINHFFFSNARSLFRFRWRGGCRN